MKRPSWSRWPPSGPDVLVEQRIHHRGEGEVEREVVAVGIAVGEVEDPLRFAHRVAEAVLQLEVAQRTVGQREVPELLVVAAVERRVTVVVPDEHRGRAHTLVRAEERVRPARRACAPAPRRRTRRSRSRTGRRSSADGTRRRCSGPPGHRAPRSRRPGRAPVSTPWRRVTSPLDHGGDVAVGVLQEAPTAGGQVVGQARHAQREALEVDHVDVGLLARRERRRGRRARRARRCRTSASSPGTRAAACRRACGRAPSA